MSTTSSPGRRPFGKPAVSPASTPSVFCEAAALGAIDVFRRIISAGFTEAGWLRPDTPVRNAATRSARGYKVGAFTPGNSAWIRIGRLGLVTYLAKVASLAGFEALNRSLSGRSEER